MIFSNMSHQITLLSADMWTIWTNERLFARMDADMFNHSSPPFHNFQAKWTLKFTWTKFYGSMLQQKHQKCLLIF